MLATELATLNKAEKQLLYWQEHLDAKGGREAASNVSSLRAGLRSLINKYAGKIVANEEDD